MGTTTKFFCDRCEKEASSRLPSYSLRYQAPSSHGGDVYCTPGADLCLTCYAQLQQVLKDFYPGWKK